MRSAAAAAVPQQQTVHPRTAPAVPQATSVGTPIARVGTAPQHPAPQRVAVQTTLTAAPAANRSYLVDRPPAPTPVVHRVEMSERGLRVGQVMCWQFAVVAVGAATAGSRLMLVATSLAAVTLVLLTAVRVRGLWLYRWAGVLLTFLLRRRRFELTGDTALDLTSAFLGRTTVSTLPIRDQQYGVLSHPGGVLLALRVGADAHELLRRLPTLTESADEQPVAVSLQLVLHTGIKQSRPPRTWIAVAAQRTSEIATDEQVNQVLTNTVRRLVRRFDREYVDCMPLDESGVLASIGALAHANAGRGQLRERWSTWAAGPVLQVCIRLTGYAALPDPLAQSLVETLLGTATGGAQTLAITVTAPADGPEPARHDAVLRVAASHPATLDAATTVLTSLARSFGVEPERLDGRHTAGVAATLPLGVPLS
ncbi:hypothetical protein BWI15_28610 [Kribbella sp. ALI-6-A]|uniref:hypothetical protein n=1 Tax=Kribbella sp. ALI-6-A TaxID=1933817 RepID=UPI00097C5AB6|nr:hypothetical protein [Kribbella sp. ALI-6-A]ONI67129.1 hypothetical protein BWI15_28610 [Kribbella sp. ALI-6-A]